MLRVFFTLILLFWLQYVVFVNACLMNCNCSMRNQSLPGDVDREYFTWDCVGEVTDFPNASKVEIFRSKAADIRSLFNINALSTFSSLKVLDIDGGLQSLTFLPKTISLRMLRVERMSQSHLSSGAISKISNGIISLSLTYSDIKTVSGDAYNGLISLLHLNMSHNQLTFVPPPTALSRLTHLDLSYNRIRGVNLSDFVEFKLLEWLNLNHNSIYSLGFVKFPYSGVSFTVRNNPINEFSWHATSDVKLKLLDVSGNRLTLLQPKTFVNANIETIRITNCSQLQFIDADIFTNSNVTNIAFSSNSRLQYIDGGAFQNVQQLKAINVSSNRLRVVFHSWAKLPVIAHIFATGNPLLCDCNMHWIDTLPTGSSTVVQVFLSSSPNISNCTAGNPINGRNRTHCPPQLLYRSPNSTVDEGATTILRCKEGGFPTPTVRWLYGGRPLPSGTNIKTVGDDLVISQSKLRNSGIYVCLVENPKGKIKAMFNVTVVKDYAKIIILNTGKDYVDFTWSSLNQAKVYKVILINVRTNNQTSYAIKDYIMFRFSQSGFVISDLQSETTYRVCLAYENQLFANSDKCKTITTLGGSSSEGTTGITDYKLYGILVATVVSFIVLCIIVCVCLTSRGYSKRKEVFGPVSESSYGLMTTSFSHKSGMSAMYDNAGVSMTPLSYLSRSSSYYKYRRAATTSAVPTPTSPAASRVTDFTCYPNFVSLPNIRRSISDPLLSFSN